MIIPVKEAQIGPHEYDINKIFEKLDPPNYIYDLNETVDVMGIVKESANLDDMIETAVLKYESGLGKEDVAKLFINGYEDLVNRKIDDQIARGEKPDTIAAGIDVLGDSYRDSLESSCKNDLVYSALREYQKEFGSTISNDSIYFIEEAVDDIAKTEEANISELRDAVYGHAEREEER